MTSRPIVFVTSNAAKVATAREHLTPLGVELEQVVLDLDEIQSDSVQQVALHKAQQAFRTLKRPLIIEDSGFYIDALNFPGPFVKHLIKAVGAEGIARMADLTADRRCHFEGVLVYIDGHGVPRVYTDHGDGGTIANKPTEDPQPGAWSALWDVFIATGCDKALSALKADERARVFAGWAKASVFTRFGESLARKRAGAAATADGRLRSANLHFTFPDERIAAKPRQRGDDLLLVLDRASGAIGHRRFDELYGLLPPRSLLVVNNSAVVKAALRRAPDDGTYLHIVDPFHADLDNVLCLCPWKPDLGATIRVGGGRYVVDAVPEPGRDLRSGRIIPDDASITNLSEFMAAHGEVPIPIYVNAQRGPDSDDATDYQNVYASVPGSVACATAGLHLSDDVMAQLRSAGHEIAEVTLHIGYGTWKSLATEFVDQHEMDAEQCEIPAATLDLIRRAKAQGRPVVAVGTSSVRTLETFAGEILDSESRGTLRHNTTLFITPGFKFRIVDHMITNFAYPQTPIMSLTTAFAGDLDMLFSAYQDAIVHGDYLFFTYGDAMFLR